MLSMAQKTGTYLLLTDASGQQIKGDIVDKGFERTIGVYSFNNSGRNNAQLTFSMNVIAAAADLKRAMTTGTLLQNGTLTVTSLTRDGRMTVSYTVRMENIRVLNCNESQGCNGAIMTTATLAASRIGWTYYQQDASGRQSVSKKFGFDNDSGREWTNF